MDLQTQATVSGGITHFICHINLNVYKNNRTSCFGMNYIGETRAYHSNQRQHRI